MTVKELIEKLKTMPENEVVLMSYSRYNEEESWTEYETVESLAFDYFVSDKVMNVVVRG